jgi:hypothetical protein
MLRRALVVWLAMVGLAVVNGAFRVGVLEPRMGEAAAHVVSTGLLCGVILLLAWLAIDWVAPRGARSALAIGVLWIGCTVAFEFGFGHYVTRKSWSELLADYDLAHGRVWLFVLLTTGAAPYLAGRWRRLL